MRNLLSFVLFQGGWFACVLAAAGGRPAVAPLATLVVLALHLAVIARDRAGELRLVAALTVAGSCLSAFNAWNGAVVFAPDPVSLGPLPLWIASLWALFATLLPHALVWLRGRPWLAALCGLVGSPLSYLGAERLGAVQIHDAFLRGPLVLGVTWAVAVPLAVRLSERLVRPAPAQG